MKKIIVLLAIISFGLQTNGQQKKLDEILKEGQLLFRLEKAAWYSSDDFMERFSDKRKDYGGYVSYETEDHFINTVFFSKMDSSIVLARYQFDSIPAERPRYIDTVNKNARKVELEVINIRLATLKLLTNNKDGFFSFYKKSNPNVIPVSTKKSKHAYIVTGPQESGVLLFGNDYKITFNNSFKVKSKKKLHKSLIRIPLDREDKVTQTIHSHIVNPYIDVTDICTALLYKDFIKCDMHIVIGKKYVTFFNVAEQKLFSMSAKNYLKTAKKINEDSTEE